MKRTHILTFGKITTAFCMECCRETEQTCTSDVLYDDDNRRFITVLCRKCGKHGYILMEEDDEV